MNIEKRGNSYRIRETYKGERYYITIHHKPTKSEAMLLIYEYIENHTLPQNPTIKQCAIAYNKSKDGAIQKSTLRKYYCNLKNIPQCIADIKIDKMSDYYMQLAISEFSKTHKYSTTKSFYIYLLEVLKMFSNKTYKVTLPQKEDSVKYIPTIDEVKKIYEYTLNTNFGALFVLLCHGLRIGEALALTIDDVKDNYIDINKALSFDLIGKRYTKAPKTYYSIRKIPLPQNIIRYIKTFGFNWKTELTYRRQFSKILKELNIQYFSFHSCRKFFASYCQHIGIGIPNIKALGGWAFGSNIMESIYSRPIGIEKPITLPL